MNYAKKYHNKIKLIKLYNSDEPMLNGALGEMLKSIKEQMYVVRIGHVIHCWATSRQSPWNRYGVEKHYMILV